MDTDDDLLYHNVRVSERALSAFGMHIEEMRGPEARVFTPAMRLSAEVLRQALIDLEAGVEECEAWFGCTSEGGHGLTLIGICATLELDVRNIRAIAADPVRRRAVIQRLSKEWNEGGRKA